MTLWMSATSLRSHVCMFMCLGTKRLVNQPDICSRARGNGKENRGRKVSKGSETNSVFSFSGLLPGEKNTMLIR